MSSTDLIHRLSHDFAPQSVRLIEALRQIMSPFVKGTLTSQGGTASIAVFVPPCRFRMALAHGLVPMDNHLVPISLYGIAVGKTAVAPAEACRLPPSPFTAIRTEILARRSIQLILSTAGAYVALNRFQRFLMGISDPPAVFPRRQEWHRLLGDHLQDESVAASA
ncbi:MAG: hypothetical protein RLY47_257 [Candidatus Parcubacteria bacterium]